MRMDRLTDKKQNRKPEDKSRIKDIKVVIGANYGDEGKGLMTDYFTDPGKSCLVVCNNGGAQRGHTVEKGPVRHVFHHFGSGTLSGADSFFSRYFILNPILFAQEYIFLKDICGELTAYRHPDCIWTTPFDMIINQMIEEHRGNGRHGSCGAGIWETVVRSRKIHLSLDTFSDRDLPGTHVLRNYLLEIRDSYLPARLKALGFDGIPEKWMDIIKNDGLIEHFMEDVGFMLDHTIPRGDDLIYQYDRVIFENGQGLLLDQNQRAKAHTTPSNTGLKNVADMIRGLDLKDLPVEVCYVTRTYLTRHGAGPFPGECRKDIINPDIKDETNIPNAFQGTLRYGIINPDELGKIIQKDFAENVQKDHGAGDSWYMSLAITHLNETGGKWNSISEIDRNVLKKTGIRNIYYSGGREKESIRKEEQ